MKNLILSLPFLWISLSASGQSYKEKQTVQMIEHTIIIPKGGSLEEALRLTKEWTENVLRKNDNFENIQLLLSDRKRDTISLMVLYKYKLNTARNTDEINQELIKRHWPKEGAFQNFIQQLHRYINPKQNKRSVFKELVIEKPLKN
tara:strand:+ start:2905 stop:3342 length:438 start_codon:yes stop_codon:yes gene_type:complete